MRSRDGIYISFKWFITRRCIIFLLILRRLISWPPENQHFSSFIDETSYSYATLSLLTSAMLVTFCLVAYTIYLYCIVSAKGSGGGGGAGGAGGAGGGETPMSRRA
jgi:hypothetical protein